MRSLLLISLLLPLAGCMTEHDKSVWAEFKAEFAGKKAAETTEAKAAADSNAAEAVQAPASPSAP